MQPKAASPGRTSGGHKAALRALQRAYAQRICSRWGRAVGCEERAQHRIRPRGLTRGLCGARRLCAPVIPAARSILLRSLQGSCRGVPLFPPQPSAPTRERAPQPPEGTFLLSRSNPKGEIPFVGCNGGALLEPNH